MSTKRRIKWSVSRFSGHHGRVGSLGTLFTIDWHTVRSDPNWRLRTSLPGMVGRTAKDDDDKMLRLEAEAWLAEFVERLGAEFAAPVPVPGANSSKEG